MELLRLLNGFSCCGFRERVGKLSFVLRRCGRGTSTCRCFGIGRPGFFFPYSYADCYCAVAWNISINNIIIDPLILEATGTNCSHSPLQIKNSPQHFDIYIHIHIHIEFHFHPLRILISTGDTWRHDANYTKSNPMLRQGKQVRRLRSQPSHIATEEK